MNRWPDRKKDGQRAEHVKWWQYLSCWWWRWLMVINEPTKSYLINGSICHLSSCQFLAIGSHSSQTGPQGLLLINKNNHNNYLSIKLYTSIAQYIFTEEESAQSPLVHLLIRWVDARKKDLTPLLMNYSYVFLALTHWIDSQWYFTDTHWVTTAHSTLVHQNQNKKHTVVNRTYGFETQQISVWFWNRNKRTPTILFFNSFTDQVPEEDT